MIEKEIVRPRSLGGALAPTGVDRVESRIVTELDHIVGRSRRRSPLRWGLRRVGGAIVQWLDQLVPPAPAPDDPEPPQIRFPFF